MARDPHDFGGVSIPFVTELGFRLTLFEGGESVIEYEPRPEHMNSFSVAHGGAVMTLLDVGMATAARSVEQDMGIVTIEMKTSFMRPSTGLLLCKSRLMHRTATMAFVESRVLDAREQLCAHATGTFKYVKRQPASGPSANALGVISTD
ncbi:PaaI family thioesterase [Ramlibacter rhizophilus]|uniref:PaaI family thioesterase n=1 Tax=Ramlibacter rhizophilus TaxID=1781167 RepID=A0A4Z0C361_9BURK|nr:PaaI family thioesterase [Ramlibacter rhizophilus]TFZ04910.1 PaaI family thioesterase [Ramlibacter rhizophilus]